MEPIKKKITFSENLESTIYYKNEPGNFRKIKHTVSKPLQKTIKKTTDKVEKINNEFMNKIATYIERIKDNYTDDKILDTYSCFFIIVNKMYNRNMSLDKLEKFVRNQDRYINYYKCNKNDLLNLISSNNYTKIIIADLIKLQNKKLNLIESKFGTLPPVILKPKTIQDTKFDVLPDDILEKIDNILQNEYAFQIQQKYKNYKNIKSLLLDITNSLNFEYLLLSINNDDDDLNIERVYNPVRDIVKIVLEYSSKILRKNELEDEYWNSTLGKIYLAMYLFNSSNPNLTNDEINNYKECYIYFQNILKKLKIYEPNWLDNENIINYFDLAEPDEGAQIELENAFGKSKVPDNVKNPKLYLKIKAKIRRDVNKKKRRWGAYDSGRLVREYKQAGGKYSGSKKSKTESKKSSNLSRWYREKWIDACVWPKRKSCGRTKATIKSKVTYCRPSKVVDKNTPKTVQELSKAEIKKRCAKKRKNPKKIIRK